MRAIGGIREGMSRRGAQRRRLIPGGESLAMQYDAFVAKWVLATRHLVRISKIKNAVENEKEQKYETITPGEPRYYWKLLTQWKWAIGIAGVRVGSLLLPFSASHEQSPRYPGTPWWLINTRRLWTPFLPRDHAIVFYCHKIIMDRRQTSRMQYFLTTFDDEILIDT